jgi:hypothetical protein
MLKQKHESTGTDFLAWLTITVPGWITEGNIDAMGYAISNLPAKSAIVEIGSFFGLSTCVITYLKRKYGVGAPFYSCDPWTFESLLWLADDSPFFDCHMLTYRGYADYVRESFVRNVLTFCQPDLPKSFELASSDFFGLWYSRDYYPDLLGHKVDLGGAIGFCYIDGNHTYPVVRRDFENTHSALLPGGFILFDDSGETSEYPDVRKVALEVAASGCYELISENPNHLFRKSLTSQ